MNESEFRSHLATMDVDQTLPGDTILRPGERSIEPAALTVQAEARPDTATTKREISLGSTIGEGGSALVREAFQVDLRRDVAAKTLRDGHAASQRASLLHEALVAGALEHPNVVPIHTLGEAADGAPIIVMKRVEGVSWQECIEDPTLAPGVDPDDPLPWHVDVLGLICRATHFAHSRGILHRDIKPENVMIGKFGEVYLVDWGIAVSLDPQKGEYLRLAADSQGVAGTPRYMAPEMTLGVGELLSERTDVFLLGACLFEVLEGRAPYDGETLLHVLQQAYECPEVRTEQRTELDAICRRAMAKEPEERFESAEEFRQALAAYRTHRASEALTERSLERLEELSAALDEGDDLRMRTLAGEVRFGLLQALELWEGNTPALEAYERWRAIMFELELESGHLAAAEALLGDFDAPPRELVDRLESARDEAQRRAGEIAELEKVRDEHDVAIGARYRWLVGAFAVVFWTVIPLIGGVTTKWGEAPLSPRRYVLQSIIVIVFVGVTVFTMRRLGYLNERNRQIARTVLATVTFIPLYRVIAMLGGISTPLGLAIEQGIYGLMFAGLGIVSGRTGIFPVIICSLAGFVSVIYPQWVYLALAASNFLMLSWLAWIWRGQQDGAQESR